MTTERINIVVTERGSRVVKRNIQAIGTTAASATRGLRLFQNALFVIGGAGIIRNIVRTVDSLNNFRNRLRLVTSSTLELNAVQKELFAISIRTRTAFATTATVFTRTAFNTKELGLSMKDTLGFTEALNKAVLISGANAREAEAATIQLSQAIASDRFSGDELRSVLEQLPFAADVIAKGLKATRGQLRQMGQDGQISAQAIIDAFLTATTEIDRLFGQLVSTVGQAFTNLSTRFQEFLGSADQLTGFSDKIITLVTAIGDNLDNLIPIILGVATVMLVRFLGPLIGKLALATKEQLLFTQSIIKGEVVAAGSTKAILIQARAADQLALAELKIIAVSQTKLRIQIANNNVTIASTRISLAKIATDIQLQRGIVAVGGSTAVLNKLIATQSGLRQVLSQAIRVNSAVGKELIGVNTAVAASETIVARTTIARTTAMAGATIGARVLAGSLTLLRGALTLVGGPFGLILLAATAWLVFGRSTDTATVSIDLQKIALAELNRELRDNLDLSQKKTDALKESFDLELGKLKRELFDIQTTTFFGKFRVPTIDVLGGAFREAKKELKRLEESFDIRPASDKFEAAFRFKQIAKARVEVTKTGTAVDKFRSRIIFLTKNIDILETSFKGNTASIKEMNNAKLNKLRSSLDSVFAAEKKRDKLNKEIEAFRENKSIGEKEEIKLKERVLILLKDQLKPFEALLSNLRFEVGLAGLSNDEREIEINLRKLVNDQLIKKGPLAEGEIATLKALLEAQQKINNEAKKKKPLEDREAVIKRVLGDLKREQAGLLLLGDARQVLIDQIKVEDQLRRALRRANPLIKEKELNELATLTEAEKLGIKEVSERISEMERLSSTIEGIFADAKSAIVDFATTGKLSIGSLFDSIQLRITQLAADQLFEQLFGLLGSAKSGGGLLGSIFSGVGSLVGIPGAATGGSFQIGGSGGTDTNVLSVNNRPIVKVSRGETVSITPSNSNDNKRSISVSVFVNTPDARSFQSQETQNQIAQGVGQSIERAIGRDS